MLQGLGPVPRSTLVCPGLHSGILGQCEGCRLLTPAISSLKCVPPTGLPKHLAGQGSACCWGGQQPGQDHPLDASVSFGLCQSLPEGRSLRHVVLLPPASVSSFAQSGSHYAKCLADVEWKQSQYWPQAAATTPDAALPTVCCPEDPGTGSPQSQISPLPGRRCQVLPVPCRMFEQKALIFGV